jgi:hypothetical protein
VAEGAARSESIVVNEVVPFNYYIAVEMFKGVNVVSPVAMIGEPANLDKKIELNVPLYSDDDLNHIKLRMIEAECRDGMVIKAECFQEINLPLAGIPGYKTRDLVVSPQWSTKELLGIRELKLRYGRIQMTCRMNQEGLVMQPTFHNPATGNKVTYPDLPVWNLGEIEAIDERTFERDFDEYAQNCYVRQIEENFNHTMELVMRTAECNRSAAVGMLISYAEKERGPSHADLRETEKQAMIQSRDEKANDIRNKYR